MGRSVSSPDAAAGARDLAGPAAAGAPCGRPAIVVSELFPPAIGGSAVLLGEIYARLTASPVRVVTDRDRSRGPRPAVMADLPVEFHALATPHWGVMRPDGVWHHLRTAAMLARLARRTSGILHCGRVLPEGLWAWMAKRLAGVPFVCWSHGEDATSARTSREYAVLMPRIYNAADAVLANSHNTARILADLGVEPSRVVVVHPGVDTVRFHPDVDGAPVRRALGLDGKFVLLTVSRIERRKGHDLVLRALAALRPKIPNLHYVIAGDGSDRPRLDALVSELGIGDAVTCAGMIRDEDLPRYYAACDVFVHPNRVEGSDLEGFGLVFLEAAAAGRPVIGGNSGGVPEAVVDGETGVLVGGEDVAELAGAIQRFVTDSEWTAACGAAARERVLRDFSWDRAARAVEQVQARVARQAGERA